MVHVHALLLPRGLPRAVAVNKRRFLIVFFLFAATWGVLGAGIAKVHDLDNRIIKLEHACIPTNTGGGVWQCRQPDMVQAPPSK